MKQFFLLLILSAFYFSIASAQKAKITGHLKFSDPIHKVYLSYSDGNKKIADSAEVKNGHFVFSEKVLIPTITTLRLTFLPTNGKPNSRIDGMQFFMEPGAINIEAKDSLKFAKVTGSKSQKDLEIINKMREPFDIKEQALNDEFMKYRGDKDEAGMQKMYNEFTIVDSTENENVYHLFLKEHPKSTVGLYVLGEYAGRNINAKKVAPLFAKLPATLKNSAEGKNFKKRIELAERTSIGAYAMNFTQNDTLGKPVSLSSFKGKYVLLDFWASWCGPCRAENPNVLKNFNEYKDKNFTVLSVSLDQPGKKEAWLNAIHKDGLIWTHVSDLKFWNNAVAKQYGISAIPQNFLIDPTGKIIAKNMRGEELDKKLDELLH